MSGNGRVCGFELILEVSDLGLKFANHILISSSASANLSLESSSWSSTASEAFWSLTSPNCSLASSKSFSNCFLALVKFSPFLDSASKFVLQLVELELEFFASCLFVGAGLKFIVEFGLGKIVDLLLFVLAVLAPTI